MDYFIYVNISLQILWEINMFEMSLDAQNKQKKNIICSQA